MTLEVIYEDNHLLAVHKPAGLLTQPTETEQDSLELLVKTWLKTTYQKPGQVFAESVHRLDKPVSGIVLFAKTSKALSRLNAAIRSKEMQKTYLALLEKTPPLSEGVLEHFLIHGEHQAFVRPEGKLARLNYRTLLKAEQGVLVEIMLETGRYHQIRAQFAAVGCPILGDTKYGGRGLYLPNAIALHHFKLQLIHPVQHTELVFISAPPACFSYKD